jgi:stearoyl-CoA desaturase (delta-9 desaturase)
MKFTGVRPGEKAQRKPPTWSEGNYEINWLSTSIIGLPPLIVLGAILFGVELSFKTFIVFLIFYALNGFGITVGYHRMFAHRAFNGHWFLQSWMAFFGGGAFQGSVKWWGRNHRIHHRYIDTDMDPYNATRGFVYTHVGWMVMKQDYDILGNVDISDLNANKIVRFQHDYYLPVALASGIVLPTLICGLGWGDWLGGYFYAALLKMVFVHHSTFFINSLAHSNFFGAKQNYSDQHSSHDSVFCALLTLGEGYHNFHHEFAQDYRNGIKWYHWDPTKWIIRACEFVGLARGLVRTPNSVISRNVVSLQHKKAREAVSRTEAKLKALDSSVRIPNFYTWSEIESRVDRGEKLVVVGDYVLDLCKPMPTGPGYTHSSKDIFWYNSHPGGRKVLDMFVGKDATEAMSGGIYKHSEAAFNMLLHLRVANLRREQQNS